MSDLDTLDRQKLGACNGAVSVTNSGQFVEKLLPILWPISRRSQEVRSNSSSSATFPMISLKMDKYQSSTKGSYFVVANL